MRNEIYKLISKHLLPSTGAEDAATDITNMLSNFFVWMYTQNTPIVLYDIDKALFYNIDTRTVWTLEEVFIYWNENIREGGVPQYTRTRRK